MDNRFCSIRRHKSDGAFRFFIWDLHFSVTFLSEVVGVSFQRVSSRFHTFRRHDCDGDFISSNSRNHSSVFFCVRYMMSLFHALLCLFFSKMHCVVQIPIDFFCGILFFPSCEMYFPSWICIMSGIPLPPCWRDTHFHMYVVWDPFVFHVGGILIFIMCNLLSYW